MRKLAILVACFMLSTAPGISAQFDKILKNLGLDKQDGLSDDTVVSGLKEALQVGTQNTVSKTGKEDGYFLNETIKILMPGKLQKLDKGLRLVDYGPQIDEFVLSMNRAAEEAAPTAKDIFWDAIKKMTFEDARKILKGGDTAATDYFEVKTSDELSTAFHPIVKASMDEVGVTQQYKDMVGRYQAIPFMKVGAFDLDQYVVEQALNGLFHVLGEEEKKIRTNPAARVTDLLQKVFGR